MSALTNYFTSLANKMRSKTGKSTTMTPSEMVSEIDVVYQSGKNEVLNDLANDTATASDVASGKTFHSASGTKITGTSTKDATTSDATAAASDIFSGKTAYVKGSKVTGTHTDVTPTSITPSASAPSMAANGVYKPTAAGYAINSYSSITPSASAPSMSKNAFYKPSAAGYAISSYSSITPSASAPAMAANTFYKAASAGYAINSYSSVTPTASGAAFSAGFRKMTAGGYAYTSQVQTFDLIKAPGKTQNVTLSASGTSSISVTAKPKAIVINGVKKSGKEGFTLLQDVSGNKYVFAKYSETSQTNFNAGTGLYSDCISSVSASAVGLKNGFGSEYVYQTGIYY